MHATPSESPITLSAALDHARDGIFAIDRDHRCVMFNAACERITGRPASDFAGRDCQCGTMFNCHGPEGEPIAGPLCPAHAIFSGEADSARRRIQVRRPDGRNVWVETIYTSVRDQQGNVELVLGILRDATETKAAEDKVLAEMAALQDRVRRLSEDQKARYGFNGVLSSSPAMAPVLQAARSAIGSSSAVLIHGEDGAGKQTLARTIHANSPRADHPFVSFNCAAHPREALDAALFGRAGGDGQPTADSHPGVLHVADGGTLFIEKITDMRPETQVSLLRVLTEGRFRPVGAGEDITVRVRVIASMSEPPEQAVAGHTLRKDLLYRLGVIRIGVPPLRRRAEDIPLLTQSLIDAFNASHARTIRKVSPAAWQALRAHAWPGNLRQFSHAIESACVMGEGDTLTKEDLPPEILGLSAPKLSEEAVASLRLDPYLHRVEREAILRALKSANWQRNKAAALMGISRSRLYRRMDVSGLDPEENR